MSTLRFVLGDQLSRGMSSLRDIAAGDVVLMVEVAEEANYVRHHKQKLVFIFSAMRHFAQELREAGYRVDYVTLDDPQNSGSFTGELARALERHRPERVIVTEASEWRVMQMIEDWALDCPVEIRQDMRFYASQAFFALWAKGRKNYRMEFFYRELRRKTGILMQGDEPTGGKWNFDSENRKPLPKSLKPPKRSRFEPDAITRDVMALVERTFPKHFGDLEPFDWAVTRADALRALAHFIQDCLAHFGDFQDAMKQGEDFLFHGLLSPYLNIGLLGAREVCRAAETEYLEGRAPLNAAEGFIRQILGWREYVRGLYWLEMPSYREKNALHAKRDLPSLYWSGQTRLNCLKQVIDVTKRTAYAHHIQRLMITGNFALLLGVEPRQIEEWYLLVYLDAYEWVELPNVHGMVMYADGGLLASKPYAASGAYINRMSDYCAGCYYDPALKTGERACPFNPLYWNFLIENETQLRGNPRMALPYVALAKMDDARRQEIKRDAAAFMQEIGI
ncbi:MAG: cryptochrome/photolyase family protein [Hyphomicrobiales bacterium]|nr:cryptochrome/photolyase family protein [Hyphomicrobiales bacterium]MDE2115454.1 cryptochrome/photolyase family protein [Hyphomicrobiales bacterium]